MSTRKQLRAQDYPSVFVRGKELKIFTKRTSLTTAQVLDSFTTPVSLVAAPGAGFAILVHRITGVVDFVAAAYATNVSLEFRYTNGSGTKVTADVGALIDATADKAVTVGGIEAALVLTANAAVVVRTANGNPATGDSPIAFSVDYSIVAVTI